MTKKIDIMEVVEDELEGRWFHYLRSRDFAWQSTIPDQSNMEVEEDDILIHKQILEGDRFPQVRYHQVFEDEAFLVDGGDVRDMLAGKLSEFLKEHNKLPFACKFAKVFKNGKVQIDYNPTGYDNFALKLEPSQLPLNHIKPEDEENGPSTEEITHYFENLETDSNNLDEEGTSSDISKISQDSTLQAIANESGKNTVCVFDSIIKKIDRRKTFYQGHENVYYMIRLEGGEGAPDTKKSTLHRELGEINAKCSENAFEKYELEEGDVVSFNGKYKEDSKDGVVLQRIMKFDKKE